MHPHNRLPTLLLTLVTVGFAPHLAHADCNGDPDRVVDPGEACDDGNTLDGDGCSSLCEVECGYSCAAGFCQLGATALQCETNSDNCWLFETGIFSGAGPIAPITEGGTPVHADGLAQGPDATFAFASSVGTSTGSHLVSVDPATGEATAIGAPLAYFVTGAAYAPDDTLWVNVASQPEGPIAGGYELEIAQIDPTTGLELARVPLTFMGRPIVSIEGTQLTDVMMHPDGTAVVVAHPTIYEVDLATGDADPVDSITDSAVGGGVFLHTGEAYLMDAESEAIYGIPADNLVPPAGPLALMSVRSTGADPAGVDTGAVDMTLCRARCGDGRLGAGEICDDGNSANGDGCSDSCQLEDGYVCTEARVDAACGTAGAGSVEPHEPFVCGPIMWNLRAGRLAQFDLATETRTEIGTTVATFAMGYRQSDDFIYAPTRGSLYRIGRDGRTVNLGRLEGLFRPTSAEFGPDGRLYAFTGGDNTYYAIDVDTVTVTAIPLDRLPTCTDIALNPLDLMFYCVSYIGDNKLYRITPSTGASEAVSTVDLGLGRFPAMFASGDGSIYGGTVGGEVYRLDTTDGTAHRVATGAGGSGDGTSCGSVLPQCNEAADCEPTDNECLQAPTCEASMCVYAPVEAATACADGFCDGATMGAVCAPCVDAGTGTDPGCDAGAPACIAGGVLSMCGECTEDADCAEGVCDTESNTCEVCVDSASGTLADNGCDGTAPACSIDAGGNRMCLPCVDDAAGANADSGCSSDAPVCDDSGATPRCVVCEPGASDATHDGCDETAPVCAVTDAARMCVGCLDDTQCSGELGVCNPGTSTCVACSEDTDCAGGLVCSPERTCVDCNTSADCSGEQVCSPALTCVECNTSADCDGASVCMDSACVPPCSTDDDCAASTPVCASSGECVVCETGNTAACMDSSDGMACVDARCGCTEDTDCAGSRVCGAGGLCLDSEPVDGGVAGGAMCTVGHRATRPALALVVLLAGALFARRRRAAR